MNLFVKTILQLSDNYAYLVEYGKDALVVDVSVAGPVLEYAENNELTIKYVLSTHHHSDHTSGNREIKEKTGALILGGDSRISSIDTVLHDTDKIDLGEISFQVIAVPGHTRTHVSYYEPINGLLFTGDTLFCCGCGRIFEGSAEQMYHSLMKLSQLPEKTSVYCGHEYTENNIEFALTFEPDNVVLQNRAIQIGNIIRSGNPSVPSSIGLEKESNPFLRMHSK